MSAADHTETSSDRRRTVALALEAWEALFRAQAALAQEFDADGDWGDLQGSEYGVLYALTDADAGVRISDLRADVLLSQAGVSRLVARLERRGLVERRADPDDARACRIVLTDRGTAAQREVGRRHARHVTAAMTRSLDEHQLATLRDLARALTLETSP